MIGDIPGVKEGQIFDSRRALHDAGVHRGLQQGIGAQGESIILSGGYVDDVDDGDMIIYTGEGGRDPDSGRQVADQVLKRGNLSLMRNYQEGNPIRVCRIDSTYAPATGYRYDGLYRIESCWQDQGIDRFLIWRYRLVKIGPSEQIKSEIEESIEESVPTGQERPTRSSVYTTRVIRNSEVGNHVKNLYKHTCQITGVKLETPSGPYAEACHIRPVGKPHDGPDTPSNVLCLSPNMHVLFDLGAISLNDDLQVIGSGTKLTQLKVHPKHQISLECIRYHREHICKLDFAE